MKIHKILGNDEKGKTLVWCGEKNWYSASGGWEKVDCKFCLRKLKAERASLPGSV